MTGTTFTGTTFAETATPQTLETKPHAIPAALKAVDRWGNWKWVRRQNRQGEWAWTKPPIDARTGRRAESNNPAHWGPYDVAIARSEKVGFNPEPGGGIFFIDLDRARNAASGEVEPWARSIVAIFAPRSYIEASPSGRGFKIIGRGHWTHTHHIKRIGAGQVEIFGRGKYTTISGHKLPGAPDDLGDCQDLLDELSGTLWPEPEPDAPPPVGRTSLTDQEIVNRARAAENGAKFDRLYRDPDAAADYGGDESAADQALANHLVFWNPPPDQVERIFSGSVRGRRDKWAARPDYRRRTIEAAFAFVTERYTPPGTGTSGPNGTSSNGRHAQDEHFEDSEDFENAPWDEPTPLADTPRPPFPTDVLPHVLGEFVDALATETQTPPALAAMMSLSALAVACQKRVVVEVRENWDEPTNIYTAVGLDSGNRKSSVARAVAAPIREHERDRILASVQSMAAAESDRRILEEQLKRTEKQAATATGDEYNTLRGEAQTLAKHLAATPNEKPPRILSDDVTTQKLAAMMADNGGRMGVLSAEGGFFDIIAGRYSRDGKSPDLQLFLMAHAGDDLPIDRLGREGEYLTAPALTLGMAVQTHVIRGLAGRPGMRATGGLARIAFAMPESFVGRRQIEPPSMSEETRAAYAGVVHGIFDLTAETASGEPSWPQTLSLSDDAYTAFIAFAKDLEPRLGPWGDLAHIADWGAKLAGLIARLAGIFHTVIAVDQDEIPWRHEISEETVSQVIRLAEVFLIPHALAAFSEMGVNPAIEAARVCRGAIERHEWERFSRREIHQVLKRRFQNRDDLDAPLALLVRSGYIRPAMDDPVDVDEDGEPRKRRGRKPSPTYDVNPQWRSQNTQNPQNE